MSVQLGLQHDVVTPHVARVHLHVCLSVCRRASCCVTTWPRRSRSAAGTATTASRSARRASSRRSSASCGRPAAAAGLATRPPTCTVPRRAPCTSSHATPTTASPCTAPAPSRSAWAAASRPLFIPGIFSGEVAGEIPQTYIFSQTAAKLRALNRFFRPGIIQIYHGNILLIDSKHRKLFVVEQEQRIHTASRRCKFIPEMRRHMFGGDPGPAGGAYALPQT